ncbi:SCO3242 family prenyltransferase [Streptomyces sp. NPDC051207]|uniref:SCO3242 family prenyltransferase n=1 Tax=Streptomyces sp. NPDC051207 TaxID=3154641 RepID=UPI003426D5B3
MSWDERVRPRPTVARGSATGAAADGGADANAGTGLGRGVGADAARDVGTDAGKVTGADAGTDPSRDPGAGAEVSAGVDAATDTGMGAGADAGENPDAGADRVAGAGVGADPRRATGTAPGRDTGAAPGRVVGTEAGENPGAGAGRGVGADAGTDPGRGTGTAPGNDPGPAHPRPTQRRAPGAGRRRAWAELLRLPALFTVPGDALAGAAAAGARPGPRVLLAIGSSLCLYEAGMALNDWADRDEDAAERPHRPLPSGRVRPAAALTAACALTGAGLALAARAGRPALAVAAPLAATVWSYDLALKHTPAGPLAMAAARGLDLLLGAAATTGHTRAALPTAALLGSHTLAVTTVSRQETRHGSPLPPLAALATTGLLAHLVTRRTTQPPAGRRAAAAPGLPGSTTGRGAGPVAAAPRLATVLGAAYAATTARPYFHAALNPSPPLTQRAVGAGIRATIPLQAALAARSGASGVALLVAALAPAGRKFARKVSVT